MAFRQIYISQPSKLNKYYGFLNVLTHNVSYKIPLDDINMIVLDNPQISLSNQVLISLSKYNICTIVCNHQHLPYGIYGPYNHYYKRLPILSSQLKATKRLRGRLWKKIIKRKILNEANALKYLHLDGYSYLNILAGHVSFYDESHCEAIAAHFYFKHLFCKDFNRRKPNAINSALNYGYSLIKSNIARSISMYGLIPNLGIWHDNKLNNFNLADDLIEPFRSLVDVTVYQCQLNFDLHLTQRSRMYLLSILTKHVRLDNTKSDQTIPNAIDIMIKSYLNCLENRTVSLNLPKL